MDVDVIADAGNGTNLQAFFDCPGLRNRHRRVFAEFGIVLEEGSVVFADHLDVMSAGRETGKDDRAGGWCFRAPGSRIQSPFIDGVTCASGPAARQNAVAGAIESESKSGMPVGRSAGWLGGNRNVAGLGVAFLC